MLPTEYSLPKWTHCSFAFCTNRSSLSLSLPPSLSFSLPLPLSRYPSIFLPAFALAHASCQVIASPLEFGNGVKFRICSARSANRFVLLLSLSCTSPLLRTQAHSFMNETIVATNRCKSSCRNIFGRCRDFCTDLSFKLFFSFRDTNKIF